MLNQLLINYSHLNNACLLLLLQTLTINASVFSQIYCKPHFFVQNAIKLTLNFLRYIYGIFFRNVL